MFLVRSNWKHRNLQGQFGNKNKEAKLRLAASTVAAKNPKHVFGKIKGEQRSLSTKKGEGCSSKHNTENSVTHPKINGNVVRSKSK